MSMRSPLLPCTRAWQASQTGTVAVPPRTRGITRMPAYEHVAGLEPSAWHNIYNLDWGIASMGFGVIWKDAMETFLDIAFTAR